MSNITQTPEVLLEHIDYLRDLPASERRELARVSPLRQVARGDRVFSEGTAAAGVFLIVSGRVPDFVCGPTKVPSDAAGSSPSVNTAPTSPRLWPHQEAAS